MMVQDQLIHADPDKPAAEPTDMSWEERSCDELRTVVNRGIIGGEQYFAAAAEIERRARQAELAACAEQIEAANRHERHILWIAALVAGVTIIVILGARYLGL
jgi:hypothetical protein